MRYVQYLILESSTKCNMAAAHTSCPSGDPRRWSCLHAGKTLDAESIARIAVEMYQKHGFRGMVGFHYFNEPTLSLPLLRRVIPTIREKVPESRFVLWTNGTVINEATAATVCGPFQQIHVTNYEGNDLSFLESHCSDLEVIANPTFDDRLEIGTRMSYSPCLRPFQEFIVDFYGNVHLCCTDWAGRASPGNVFHEGLAAIVRRFQTVRDSLYPAMTPASPLACRTCSRRWPELYDLVPEVAAETRKHLEQSQRSQSPP